jgi:phage shock protein PspC (stress-responsive transcriptional regulator)
MAEALGWSPLRVRMIWVLATLFTAFAGVIVYLVFWFFMPKACVEPPFELAPLQPWKRSAR